MANLNDYINFNVTLSKGSGSSSLILSDPNDYPPGVDEDLLGYFVITQPDTITITGNFGFPDISWNGTSLSTATKQLRLRADGEFQQGEYTIAYHVIATGYDETILTRTLDLSFTTPTVVIDDNMDVFTPALSVTDDTDYDQDGMTVDSVTRSWDVDIISVEGTDQNITGSTETFSLSYLGSFYDSQYDVLLTVDVLYSLDAPDDWATVQVILTKEVTLYAFIPPTILELLEMLTEYKATVDAGNCICGTACVDNCTNLKATYSLAVSIYTHIVERGRNGQITGLDAYVLQLEKLLHNCVTPTYTNTNEAIAPYDWGASGSGTVFTFYKQMIVGSGVNNAPADGATSYTDALLVGKNVIVYLDSLLMTTSLSDRVSISYDNSTGTITWNTPLASAQAISIFTYE